MPRGADTPRAKCVYTAIYRQMPEFWLGVHQKGVILLSHQVKPCKETKPRTQRDALLPLKMQPLWALQLQGPEFYHQPPRVSQHLNCSLVQPWEGPAHQCSDSGLQRL